MADQSHQDKSVDCVDVEPAVWNQTNVIVRKICTFLGSNDLSSFRLVCRKWKQECSPFWEHCVRSTLIRFSELGDESFEAIRDELARNHFPSLGIGKMKLPELTLFQKYRPPGEEYDYDYLGAEEIFDFGADKDDDEMANLTETSFLVVRLRQWNWFGSFLPEQEGKKWVLDELTNKVMFLTLDSCHLSISKDEFFPTLCSLTELKKLTIRGTYFELSPSFKVKPTLEEISALPNLKTMEMNYVHCTEKRMPNYTFPWDLVLEAMPNMEALILSYSNRRNLKFAFHRFSELMDVILDIEPGKIKLKYLIFKNIAEPNATPVIPKTEVKMIVSEMLNKLDIETKNLQLYMPFRLPWMNIPMMEITAHLPSLLLGFIFEDQDD